MFVVMKREESKALKVNLAQLKLMASSMPTNATNLEYVQLSAVISRLDLDTNNGMRLVHKW